MSLYDDYETVKKLPQTQQRINPSIKFLESHLRSKKALHKSSHNKQTKNVSTLAPVIDLRKNVSPTKSILKSPNNRNIPLFHSFETSTFFLGAQFDWGYNDEYDPAHPCDYFDVRKELQIWREQQEQIIAELVAQNQHIVPPKVQPTIKSQTKVQVQPSLLINKNFLSNYGYDSDDNSGDEKEIPSTLATNQRKGAEIAPPSSLMETSLFVQKDLNMATLPRMGEVVAAKIMAKYGFKEGQGLGKDEQGMSTALQVQRTVRNCGRILHEKDLMPPPAPQIVPSKKLPTDDVSTGVVASTNTPMETTSINDQLKNPSKIVLLSNVVGPGEVDNDLETEIRDECKTKYGDVVKVLIFERNKVPEEEAVRVFVEFKRPEQAIKAIVGLNGRYFGGRTIKANFYNVDNYYNFHLCDPV